MEYFGAKPMLATINMAFSVKSLQSRGFRGESCNPVQQTTIETPGERQVGHRLGESKTPDPFKKACSVFIHTDNFKELSDENPIPSGSSRKACRVSLKSLCSTRTVDLIHGSLTHRVVSAPNTNRAEPAPLNSGWNEVIVNRARGLETLLLEVEGKPAAMVALARLMGMNGDKATALDLSARALDLAPGNGEVRAIAAEVMSANVPHWHFDIVRDDLRNDEYEAALTRAVFPGCKVLEIGTGTGLLAMMAARAGAAEVVTCESDGAIAMAAREIIARNGFASRVRVVTKHSTEIDVVRDLGGPADILVSEIVSNDLLGEGTIPVLEHAVRHLLKPGAKVIPARGRVRIALAHDEEWEDARMGQVAGFDLSPFNRLAQPYREIYVGSSRLMLRSDAADLFSFDFASGGPFPESNAETTLAAQGRRVTGIAQWIALDMDNEGLYENRPQPGAHSSWWMIFHPFDRPLETTPGQQVTICGRHNRDGIRVWAEH